MKTILEIYQEYKIMPQLQEHQLRVAGAASLICQNFAGQIDAESIVKACLLHDMGNIVKFDLLLFPEFVREKGLSYWQGVKSEFAAKYGVTSHQATAAILREMGIGKRVRELVDAIGFSQATPNAESADFDKKICAYSDMRVGPFGIISLEQRFVDLRARYQNHPEGAGRRGQFEVALREVEKQIFARCKILPGDIKDSAIKEITEKLKNLTI